METSQWFISEHCFPNMEEDGFFGEVNPAISHCTVTPISLRVAGGAYKRQMSEIDPEAAQVAWLRYREATVDSHQKAQMNVQLCARRV